MLLPRLSVCLMVMVTIVYHITDVEGLFGILGSGFGAAGSSTVGLSAGGATLAMGGLAVAAAGIAGLGLAALAYGALSVEEEYNDYDYGYEQPAYGQEQQTGYGHEQQTGYGHEQESYGGGGVAVGGEHESYGGGGGAVGGGGSSYGGSTHRHRRSIRSNANSVKEKQLSKMFSVVSSMDTYGCALKLVCDLYKTPNSYLTIRERSVKRLLGGHQHVESTRDPRYAYVAAATLGGRGYDCNKIYAACPLSDRQVKEYLNSLAM